jgi:hypothetical protein
LTTPHHSVFHIPKNAARWEHTTNSLKTCEVLASAEETKGSSRSLGKLRMGEPKITDRYAWEPGQAMQRETSTVWPLRIKSKAASNSGPTVGTHHRSGIRIIHDRDCRMRKSR